MSEVQGQKLTLKAFNILYYESAARLAPMNYFEVVWVLD